MSNHKTKSIIMSTIINKLPASLSLTTWCAKAAECKLGILHVIGAKLFRCGFNLIAWLGEYNGYVQILLSKKFWCSKVQWLPLIFSLTGLLLSIDSCTVPYALDNKRDMLKDRLSLFLSLLLSLSFVKLLKRKSN